MAYQMWNETINLIDVLENDMKIVGPEKVVELLKEYTKKFMKNMEI